MGKGYNNFMSKKTFHPGSSANQKRIKEAEEKAAAKRKHDEETLAQYQKEQELFQQKSLVSRESKDKLSLNFMYEAPASSSQNKDQNKLDSISAGETSMKWKHELQVKKETSQAKKKPKTEHPDSSSSDDESNIVLSWNRDEPKAKKKVKTEK